MEPTDLLSNILTASGISPDDMRLWQKSIFAMSVQERETFVYILGQLSVEDVSFLNENLKSKLNVFSSDSISFQATENILTEEKKYLLS
jgi:hypothetical protein